jgi:hypothetical protein
MRSGHLWGRHEIVVPIADVETFGGDRVRLRLDRGAAGTIRCIGATHR